MTDRRQCLVQFLSSQGHRPSVVKVLGGEHQTIRYDDGTSDKFDVPLGTTTFFSGATMSDICRRN